MTHHLTERLAQIDPALASWKVQTTGRRVEFWLLRPSMRPQLVGKIDEANVLSNVATIDGLLAPAQIMQAWEGIVAS